MSYRVPAPSKRKEMTYSTPKLSETLAIASETCTSESESEESGMINYVVSIFFFF